MIRKTIIALLTLAAVGTAYLDATSYRRAIMVGWFLHDNEAETLVAARGTLSLMLIPFSSSRGGTSRFFMSGGADRSANRSY